MFSFTSKEEHEEEVRRLNAERFIRLKTVSGTCAIHSVIPVSENKIAVKTYSGSPENPREVAVVKRAARGRGGESVYFRVIEVVMQFAWAPLSHFLFIIPLLLKFPFSNFYS